MAYPTVSGPYGLKPVKMISGSPYNGVTRQYRIASAYATNIFYGDVVKLVTGGTVERDVADAAMTPIGVFLGCSFTDPGTSQPTFKQYWPASTVASDARAFVVDARDVLFKVAVISSAAATTPIVMADLAIIDIGANVQMVDNVGSTVTGNSKIAVDDTSATTATFPLRVVDVVPETLTSDGYPEVLVKWNAGHMFDNTTGV